MASGTFDTISLSGTKSVSHHGFTSQPLCACCNGLTKYSESWVQNVTSDSCAAHCVKQRRRSNFKISIQICQWTGTREATLPVRVQWNCPTCYSILRTHTIQCHGTDEKNQQKLFGRDIELSGRRRCSPNTFPVWIVSSSHAFHLLSILAQLSFKSYQQQKTIAVRTSLFILLLSTVYIRHDQRRNCNWPS
jgi:hypothetical protein